MSIIVSKLHRFVSENFVHGQISDSFEAVKIFLEFFLIPVCCVCGNPYHNCGTQLLSFNRWNSVENHNFCVLEVTRGQQNQQITRTTELQVIVVSTLETKTKSRDQLILTRDCDFEQSLSLPACQSYCRRSIRFQARLHCQAQLKRETIS